MRRVTLLAITAIALTISGCSTSSTDPLAKVLNSDPTAEDTIPTSAQGKTDILEESARFVGEDVDGVQYFIGSNTESNSCLLVYISNEMWGSSCGDAGSFNVSMGGKSAWLMSPSFKDVEATENIDDVVFIAPVS